MKLFRKSRKKPFSIEEIGSNNFWSGESEEAEQLIQKKRCMIFDYKLNKILYKDTFDGDIEEDEEYDDILGSFGCQE